MSQSTESRLTIIKERISSEKVANEFMAALPSHISVEKFRRVVLTAINKNPDLADANLQSLLTSCVECAQDGLLPDGKEAALVIYNINTAPKKAPKVWVKKVQYMPMIKGICKKAHNSGELPFLDMQVVYQNDSFDYELGLHPNLIHKPILGDRGHLIGAYAVARTKSGAEYIEVMSKDEIEQVRTDASKSKSKETGEPYGPWKTYYGEMARKTVLRRLSKRLPLSADLSQVIERVDSMHTFENNTGTIALDAPPRPQPENYKSDNKEPVELYGLINAFGESMGELNKDDFVKNIITLIEDVSSNDLLDAILEHNADALEMLGTRSDERKEISEVVNMAKENFTNGDCQFCIVDENGNTDLFTDRQDEFLASLTSAIRASDKPKIIWENNATIFDTIKKASADQESQVIFGLCIDLEDFAAEQIKLTDQSKDT